MRATSSKIPSCLRSRRRRKKPDRSGIGRFPPVREQFVDPAIRVGLDAGEHVRQVRDGVHAVFFARRDERVEHGVVVTRLLVSDKEVVRSAERDAAEPSLGWIIVRWDGRVSKEASERTEVPQKISDRLRDTGAGFEAVPMTTSPTKELGEEGARASLSELEMR